MPDLGHPNGTPGERGSATHPTRCRFLASLGCAARPPTLDRATEIPQYSGVSFEWDDAKAKANLSKHGVDFADAEGVFDDPHRAEWPDSREKKEYHEKRS